MKNSFSQDTVVIIGGGVAGLTAANLLARDGFRVALIEAASKLGGSCASTTFAGYTFNDGAVYLAVISVLDHVFQKLGLNRAELLPLRKITSISSTNRCGILASDSNTRAPEAHRSVRRHCHRTSHNRWTA